MVCSNMTHSCLWRGVRWYTSTILKSLKFALFSCSENLLKIGTVFLLKTLPGPSPNFGGWPKVSWIWPFSPYSWTRHSCRHRAWRTTNFHQELTCQEQNQSELQVHAFFILLLQGCSIWLWKYLVLTLSLAANATYGSNIIITSMVLTFSAGFFM